MARQTVIEVIDTPLGKRLRIQETNVHQREVDAPAVEHILANMDRRIAAQQAELTALQAERDDLADKLAQLQAAEAPAEPLEPGN